MRKVFKNLKKCMAFCLAAALVFSVPTFAAETNLQKWSLSNQDQGTQTTVTAFGASDAEPYVYSGNNSKSCYGALYNTNGDVEVGGNQWLVIDVNLATDDQTAKVNARGAQDRSTTKDTFSIEPNKWHSVRLAVKNPDGTKQAKEGDGDATLKYSEHKLFIDGKLVRHYDPSNMTNNDNYMVYNGGTASDSEAKWYIRLSKAKNYKSYSSDLRISAADTVGDTFAVPELTTNEKFAVLGDNKIYSKSANGLNLSDITYQSGTVKATRKSADGTDIAVTGALEKGDTILVKDNCYFLNTYTYMGDQNVILDASTYENLQQATNGTVRKETGVFGKDSADESAILKNEKNGKKNTNPYFNLGSAEGKIAGMDYMVFELNVKPNENCQRVYFTSTGGGAVAHSISSDALQKDCWNKIIIVVNTKVNENGKYTNTIYINGTQITTAEVPKKLGDVVSSTDSRIMTDIRLNADCNTDAEAVDVAYVDDVKIYETFVAPTVLAYTVTNSANAAYDSQNAIIYAKNDDAITAACGGTVAKREVGYVIVNRGNENYSRYQVRTIADDTIGYDKTTGEFWSTAASFADDARLIYATYSANNELSKAEILTGTKIGGHVIVGKYQAEDNKTTKLYFWNMNSLEANAVSETVQ